MKHPFVIGVGGFTSNVGKTTLLCELLRSFPGWEAIKTTRGHYRSCGKDPAACCVSHLLAEEPLIRSGREQTYEAGKDTGRFWDAGAANVHWLIATDSQIEKGIKLALERVTSEGVFIEGNSFSQFIPTNYFVMVRRSESDIIKRSARNIIEKASAIYISDIEDQDFAEDCRSVQTHVKSDKNAIPLFTRSDLPFLMDHLRAMISGVAI
jgi:molybdopterin-guanine dinucleotide biosynthesis protein